MPEHVYALVMLNMLEYAWIYLNKQSCEYARILNMTDAVHRSVFLWQCLINYIFSISLNSGTCHTSRVSGTGSELKMLLRMYIFGIFLLFFIKKMCLYHFHFFFRWSTKFPHQNIDQSETGFGNTKLSVELYDTIRLN